MNTVRRGFLRGFALAVLLIGGVSASQAGTFQAFAEALQQRGWQVAWDPQGNLILSGFRKAAAGDERPTGQAATAVPTRTPRPAVTDALAERLAATGWHVARDRDGSLLLTGFTRPSPAVRESEPAAVPDATGGLAERLAATGWHVGRDARGGLLFSRAEPTAASGATGRADRWAERRPALDRLADRLAASGWHVDRDSGGGIILRGHGGGANASSLAQADPAISEFRIDRAQRLPGTAG